MRISDLDVSDQSEPGLTLVTGPNGSGKSTAARALEARVAGSWLLSAESQQAFYEAQLAADEANFQQGVDTSSTVRELLGAPGRSHPLFAAFRLEALWDRRSVCPCLKNHRARQHRRRRAQVSSGRRK